MKHIAKLHEAVAAVCPIDGVSSSGRIDFRPEATELQRAAAGEVFASWDPADPVDARADRYKAETEPLLLVALAYDYELKGKSDPALEAKRDQALAKYQAARVKIRQEVPDK